MSALPRSVEVALNIYSEARRRMVDHVRNQWLPNNDFFIVKWRANLNAAIRIGREGARREVFRRESINKPRITVTRPPIQRRAQDNYLVRSLAGAGTRAACSRAGGTFLEGRAQPDFMSGGGISHDLAEHPFASFRVLALYL